MGESGSRRARGGGQEEGRGVMREEQREGVLGKSRTQKLG